MAYNKILIMFITGFDTCYTVSIAWYILPCFSQNADGHKFHNLLSSLPAFQDVDAELNNSMTGLNHLKV